MKVEIPVPMVPVRVEISVNMVENWHKLSETVHSKSPQPPLALNPKYIPIEARLIKNEWSIRAHGMWLRQLNVEYYWQKDKILVTTLGRISN